MNYSNVSTFDLLSKYGAILDELKNRKIVRNSNPPTGGYAEYLASMTLGLKLKNDSNTGYDATDKNNNRYEIKARRLMRHNSSRQLSAIRNVEKCHFDFLIGILFCSNFSILKAALIPHAVVVEKGVVA